MSGKKKREDKREIRLYYLDESIPAEDVEKIIETAWQDIYDLEFDLFFGRFRGIHREGELIHVTWENAYGATFVSTILPDQDHTRIDYCPRELYDKEELYRKMEKGGK